MRKIVLYGGSFNPPSLHHETEVRALAKVFDAVVVVPFGPRPGKPLVNDAEPIYRAVMADIVFASLPKCRVELFDLEKGDYTKSHELLAQFQAEGEVWLAVDSVSIAQGAKGKSRVHQEWEKGKELWKEANFAVLKRADRELNKADLPAKHILIEVPANGSSEAIREKLFHRQPVEGLVNPKVIAYIERHGLYRGTRPHQNSKLSLSEIRPLVVVDKKTPEAEAIASRFRSEDSVDTNLIIVVGGDGAMLRAIRKHWRRRIPFYGINAGHLGFLLNDRSAPPAPNLDMSLYQVPLLWTEMEDPNGMIKTGLAFNDVWAERARGQTAWVRILVNGKERISHLMADAVLVSTAAGSASYARAMGAQPLPLGTSALLLVGSNVLRPIGWRNAVLPIDTEVELFALETEKRPMHAYTDGFSHGRIRRMKIRTSQSAAVELVFQPEHDPAEKLARIQFP